jgi:membrane-associated HD superfamily phosphohydrolase
LAALRQGAILVIVTRPMRRLKCWREFKRLKHKEYHPLNVRLKKLIGTVLLVALVVIYALGATTFATYRLAQSSALTHLVFFAVSGLLWILPAMGLISWMERKPRGRRPDSGH